MFKLKLNFKQYILIAIGLVLFTLPPILLSNSYGMLISSADISDAVLVASPGPRITHIFLYMCFCIAISLTTALLVWLVRNK